MKESFKTMLKTAAIMGTAYLLGHIKGVIDATKGINDKLKEDHGLTIDSVAWKPVRKVDEVKISTYDKKEEKNEEAN